MRFEASSRRWVASLIPPAPLFVLKNRDTATIGIQTDQLTPDKRGQTVVFSSELIWKSSMMNLMFDKHFLSLLDSARWAVAFVLCLQLAPGPAIQRSSNCTDNSSSIPASKLWPEADQLFRSDPRWLGGDAAFSVDLGAGRVLWLFGDSLVARKAPASRKTSIMVRNSVAIQAGYDPVRATLKFYWGVRRGQPIDFAPPEGKIWLWPAHGIRLGDRLLLFYSRVAPEHKKDSLGFKLAGWTAFLIDNPGQEPSAWTLRRLDVPDSQGKIIVGISVIQIDDFLYVFGASEPEHDVYLVRWPASGAAKGQLLSPEWWCGSDGWQSNISKRRPIIRDVSSEFSIQRDPRGNGFVEVNTQGFGAADLVMRCAQVLQGPWSGPQKFYRPPESDGPDPFVYAGKSHPELTGADLIITYVASGSDQVLANNMSVYYPRFVRLNFGLPDK
jgi:hypothetical protein